MILPPNWKLYAAAAIAITGFGAGWTVNGWKQAALTQHAVKVAAKRTAKAATAINTAAATYETQRQAISEKSHDAQIQIRTIFRTVPAGADCAAPVAVVGLLNGAIDAANAAAAGQPVGPVSSPASPADPAG